MCEGEVFGLMIGLPLNSHDIDSKILWSNEAAECEEGDGHKFLKTALMLKAVSNFVKFHCGNSVEQPLHHNVWEESFIPRSACCGLGELCRLFCGQCFCPRFFHVLFQFSFNSGEPRDA